MAISILVANSFQLPYYKNKFTQIVPSIERRGKGRKIFLNFYFQLIGLFQIIIDSYTFNTHLAFSYENGLETSSVLQWPLQCLVMVFEFFLFEKQGK